VVVAVWAQTVALRQSSRGASRRVSIKTIECGIEVNRLEQSSMVNS
jgi:hypothetical protein